MPTQQKKERSAHIMWKAPGKRTTATARQGRGPRLQVHYSPGVGGGGTDNIVRPTLMCVGDEQCYRLVKESFGRLPQEEGVREMEANPSFQG